MYLLGQTAHTIGNLWLSHWSDENAENPDNEKKADADFYDINDD